MNRVYILLLLTFITLGAIYRYIGISKNHSYWNDESHTALFARTLINDTNENLKHSTGLYQIGQYVITAASFALLGETELAGRLPSVIVGTLLIGVMFFITYKLFNKKIALITAFITTFAQMQLAWSTQLRPYIWLELFTVLIFYLLFRYLQEKNIISRSLVIATLLAIIASLFHGTGVINFVLILTAIVYKSYLTKDYKLLLMSIPSVMFLLFILYFSMDGGLKNIVSVVLHYDTEIVHYNVYLLHDYLWLNFGAFLGFIFLLRKNRSLGILLTAFITTIFLIAIFKINGRYVRYSLPAFPLLYILFSVGVVETSRFIMSFFHKKSLKVATASITTSLFLIVPIFTEKILLLPRQYYSINADMRENPIVDYKSAFHKIKKLIEGKEQETIIMDAWTDRVPWYLPEQEFVWINRTGKGEIDPIYGEKIISTKEQFEEIKKQYRYGVVIVENWESQTSPEMQDYLKRTLKHEFDVDTVPGNEDDPWSISVYSWGL